MKDLVLKLERITQKDKRYRIDAYEFVLEALSFTQKKTKKKRHISGQELVYGIKEYALEQFGGLSKAVFDHWGIKVTEDFGEIVFNMIKEEILYKTEKDSKDDFRDAYDFKEAFKARFDIKVV